MKKKHTARYSTIPAAPQRRNDGRHCTEQGKMAALLPCLAQTSAPAAGSHITFIIICGVEISVRAKIYPTKDFSAHADQDGLLAWYRRIGTPSELSSMAKRGRSSTSTNFWRIRKKKCRYWYRASTTRARLWNQRGYSS